jgi:hypothetical protein
MSQKAQSNASAIQMRCSLRLAGILLALACGSSAVSSAQRPERVRHNFDLRGDARTLFENVAAAYGILCRFDADFVSVAAIRFRIDDADYATAIRGLEAATAAFTIPLSSNLILVAPDTRPKRAELEPYVAVTVDIPQTTTAEELKNLTTAVQQVMGVQKASVDSEHHQFVLRGPVSTVVPARVLLEGLLQYQPEVSIEVKVLEVSRDDLLVYGLDLPTALRLVSVDSLSKAPTALAELAKVGLGGLYSINIGNAALLAQMEHFGGRTLLDLETRSRNHGTVTFHAGDRYPVLTAAFVGPGANSGGGDDSGDGGAAAPPGAFGSAPAPAAIAAADFNRDGIADFAAAASGDDSVYVYLGRGDGSFGAPAKFPAGAKPSAIATADLNGDDRADLIVANSGSNSVSILLGRSDGGFDSGPELPTGLQPISVAVADFNNDGASDIFTANADSSDLSLFLGDGEGSFGQAAAPGLNSAPSALRASDLNGDGRPDLAIVSSTSSDLTVFLSRGDGTFDSVAVRQTGKAPVAVAAGDLNRDGTMDIVTANSEDATVTLFLGDGRGGLTEGLTYPAGGNPSDVAVGDFNMDGLPDLATAAPEDGAVFLLPGGGTGIQSPIAFHTGTKPATVAVADWNRDGVPDLLTANRLNDNFSILLGLAGGGYRAPSGQSFPATGQSFAPTPQFQFEDLGLVVKATPHVNGDSEVTLVLDVESKALTGRFQSGIPVISNRKLSSEVQVRNGEWVAVGGLLTDSEARDAAGLPLIGKHTREKTHDQVLVLIRTNLLSLPPVDPAPVPLGSETRPRSPL